MNTSKQHSRFKAAFKQYGGIIIALIALCVFFALKSERFLSLPNFLNILQQVSVVAIAAFGMTWVILLGEIDLSVGSMIALAGMIGAQALSVDWGFGAALFCTLVAGLLMGLCNGLLTAKLLLPSFIVTVATMGVFRGMVSLPTNGSPQSIGDATWLAIGGKSFLHLPWVVWILLVVFLINHIALAHTTFGRKAYLTGGNPEAARYSGIRTDRVKIIIFSISGLMSAIAGILLSSRLYSAQTNAATGYELDAIAAAVLGGTSLAGGSGTMIGTLIGALIIGVLNNGMNMLSVPYFYQLIIKGLVIVLAVWLDVYAKRKEKRA